MKHIKLFEQATPSNTLEIVSVTVNGVIAAHKNGILVNNIEIPTLEKEAGATTVIWTIKSRNTEPLIITSVKGDDLGIRFCSVDFYKAPILPGRPGTISLKIEHLSGLNCNSAVGSFSQQSLYVTTNQGQGTLAAKFIRKADPERAETCLQSGREATHNLLTVVELGSLFIPLVGPFISAGISAYDAKLYWDEGDKQTAGLCTLFMLLPGIGKAVAKIPGIEKLGTAGMSKLASKLAKKEALGAVEKEVVTGIAKNKSLIQELVNSAAKTKAAKLLASPAVKKIVVPGLKNIAAYGVLGAGYTAAWSAAAESGKFGLAEFIKSYGYRQEEIATILSSFNSDDSKEQNQKLMAAMKEGWRPGLVVPEKWRTKKYSESLKRDTDNLANLEKRLTDLGF